MSKVAPSASSDANQIESGVWDELRQSFETLGLPPERLRVLNAKFNVFIELFYPRRASMVMMKDSEVNTELNLLVSGRGFTLPKVVPDLVKDTAWNEIHRLRKLCDKDPSFLMQLSRMRLKSI